MRRKTLVGAGGSLGINRLSARWGVWFCLISHDANIYFVGTRRVNEAHEGEVDCTHEG